MLVGHQGWKTFIITFTKIAIVIAEEAII